MKDFFRRLEPVDAVMILFLTSMLLLAILYGVADLVLAIRCAR